MNSRRRRRRCWRCTWPLSTLTSYARSKARRPARKTSSSARSTGSSPVSTKCWRTNARSSSSRAWSRRFRVTCRSAPEPPEARRREHMTATVVPTTAAHTRHRASPWPVFWVSSVAAFLVSLDSTMLYSAFGALRAAFPEASAADLSWVLNAYTVVYAAMLIPAGGISDARGRKRVFLFGVTVFIAASAACGLAGSVGWLIAARVLQAAGAALLTPASLSIVLAAFPQDKRALTVSLWGAVGGFAAAVGPSLGSFLVQNVGWPWAFFINLPIGAISLWRGAALLAESPPATTKRRIDFVGMVLLVVAVGAIALAI